MVRQNGLEAAVKIRRRGQGHARAAVRRPWIRFYAGRLLQVTGLTITLVAATAFFFSSSITAMLKMMVVGVCFFLPGWLLARRNPRRGQSS